MNFKPPDLLITDSAWEGFSVQERALQIARYFADTLKLREHGVNRGFWVERFLSAVGLGGGYAWCAAFVYWCIKNAGWSGKLTGGAAVRNWIRWARETNRIVPHSQIKRGMIFAFMTNQTQGHMGFVVRSEKRGGDIIIHTIEGNTNRAGSREGDGVYRRERTVTNDYLFIGWW